MFRRGPFPLSLLLLIVLAGCGTPATIAPTFPPTNVPPTRVPVIATTAGTAQATTVAAQPTTAPTSAPTTAVPPTTAPSATPVPPTATSVPPTATTVPPTATQAEAAASGDPTSGKTLFEQGPGNNIPACGTCHNTDTPDVKVGPSLQGIVSRAGTRVQGQDARTYIHTSIVDPNAFIVPNDPGHIYSADGKTSLMYQTYSKDLSAAQIDDIIAYLLTLK